VLVASIAIDQFCGGLATAAFTAFLMSLCNKDYSAFQYALLTSAAAFFGRIVGASSGYIVEAAGWVFFFGLTIAIAAPALILLKYIKDRDDAQPAEVAP